METIHRLEVEGLKAVTEEVWLSMSTSLEEFHVGNNVLLVDAEEDVIKGAIIEEVNKREKRLRAKILFCIG